MVAPIDMTWSTFDVSILTQTAAATTAAIIF